MGDTRRTRRLVKTGAALAASEAGTLPSAFASWADVKAAYRLLSSEEATHEAILQPHLSSMRRASAEEGVWLHLEDTTTLSFNQRTPVEGLGWTGYDEKTRGQGLFVHSGLAVRVNGWDDDDTPRVTVAGLLTQHWWARTAPPRPRGESERARWERSRESERWAAWYEEDVRPTQKAEWIYVADREADAYEIFERCRAGTAHFIVRARVDRALAEDDRRLFAAVADAPCLGTFCLDLRTRGETPARKARVEVRSVSTVLRGPWRPGGWLPASPIGVVEVREVDAPPGAAPIYWVLLTDRACEDFEAACRVVRYYGCRWLIEEYHKALKTGLGIEKTQLSTVKGITALLAILAVAAVRLLDAKLRARVAPEAALEEEMEDPAILELLEARYGRPVDGWRQAEYVKAIARMGGFLARKGDGMPGWQTIWRGWQRLQSMRQGYLLAKNLTTCG